MRVLLDECLPRRLSKDFPGHQAGTVTEQGWAGIKDAPLLRLAAGAFDCFITVDRNLRFQQNLMDLPLHVIVLGAAKNDYPTLARLVPGMRAALAILAARPPGEPGMVVHVPS
jgi:predicted nuclease of predicted toxin-antitoxin system